MVEKVLFARELLAKLLARRQQTGSRFGCTPEVVTPTKYASRDEVARLAKRRMGVRLMKSFAKAPVDRGIRFRESETCTE